MKRIFVFISLLMAVSLLLSACGPAATPQTVKETVVVQQTVAAPAGQKYPVGTNAWAYDPNKPVNDGKPITLKLWNADEKYDKFFKQYATLYSAYHPNVTFEISFTPWGDYWKKLPLAISGGQGPDVFHFHNNFTTQFVDGNLIEPYPDEWIPALKQDFLQIEPHIINGKLYFFDNGLMTSLLFYNTKMWKEAGLTEKDVPKTWADFTAVAKKLTKIDASGKMTVEGFAMNDMTYYVMHPLIFQQGDYLFSADGKSVLVGDAAKKAVQQLYDWYYTDNISSVDFPAANDSFGTGKAAMVYDWGWYGAYVKQTYPSLEWDVAPIPTWTGNIAPAYDRNNGDATPGVNPKISADRKAVAFDFIHFLLDNEQATIDTDLMTAQGPVMKRIVDRSELKASKITSLSASLLDRTIWPGPFPSTLDDICLKTINDGLKTQQSVDG